jgi:hypothetical protein
MSEKSFGSQSTSAGPLPSNPTGQGSGPTPSGFPERVSGLKGVPQRMFLSQEVPVHQEGWGDPDQVGRTSSLIRMNRRFRFFLHRFKTLGGFEILAVILILAGLMYFLNNNAKPGGSRNGRAAAHSN